MTTIETQNLRFRYNGANVIDGVTFTVGAGETWAVIGRNGAGKSTLIKCLCGLLAPERGHGAVLIGGVNISELTPREIARQIAYVPQGASRLPPPFTVREYLMMARYPYGGAWAVRTAEDKRSVDDALVVTGISRLADRAMNALSGGELQTALIAGAIAQETPFLLLDEPTTYLDPYHQENIRAMIGRIHKQRAVTVITVTHDVNFALSTHDNVLALIGGRVFFCGAKENFCAGAEENLSKIFSVDFRSAEHNAGFRYFFTNGGAV